MRALVGCLLLVTAGTAAPFGCGPHETDASPFASASDVDASPDVQAAAPPGGAAAVDAEADALATPDAALAPPVSVGLGVSYQRVGVGNAVLVVYGGYTAELSWTEAWARELVRASLGARGVGHVYAAQGPKDASYTSKEIGNSGLRAHLAALTPASFILVVAHSSGSYVAHELMQQLDAANADATLGKVVYANLDGGEPGFDAGLAAKLRRALFVFARDPSLASGLSANASTATALGAKYAAFGGAFEVLVPGTGCNSGAKWCLHDVVVTHRPHDPATFNLSLDYTDFQNRPVTTEYIDAVATYLM